MFNLFSTVWHLHVIRQRRLSLLPLISKHGDRNLASGEETAAARAAGNAAGTVAPRQTRRRASHEPPPSAAQITNPAPPVHSGVALGEAVVPSPMTQRIEAWERQTRELTVEEREARWEAMKSTAQEAGRWLLMSQRLS